jgi:hypothetical protein
MLAKSQVAAWLRPNAPHHVAVFLLTFKAPPACQMGHARLMIATFRI